MASRARKKEVRVKVEAKDSAYAKKEVDWAVSAQNFSSTSTESNKQNPANAQEDSIAVFLRENADRIEEIITGTGNGKKLFHFALTCR